MLHESWKKLLLICFPNNILAQASLSIGFACQAAIFCISIWTEARNEWQIVSTILSDRSFFYTWWADKMVYWAMKLEETVNSIMTFTPCKWEANAEKGIRMIVLRVLGTRKWMISVPFFVPASLVLLILKFRTLLKTSFLEEIKHRDRAWTGQYGQKDSWILGNTFFLYLYL